MESLDGRRDTSTSSTRRGRSNVSELPDGPPDASGLTPPDPWLPAKHA